MKNLNETLAVVCTKSFGTMWMFYLFTMYGVMPLVPILHPYQDSFLYWSNFVQLIALPLILVGTNILGRDAETRAKLDHEKLAESYTEQLATYQEIILLMGQQNLLMDELQRQDGVLSEQTDLLKTELALLKEKAGVLDITRPY